MKQITNVSFLTLEFDFGEEGRIDSEVFVEINDNGEQSRITHKVRLDEVSFKDFMSDGEIHNLSVGDGFGSLTQLLRRLVAMKVAVDLNMELADVDYVANKPLRDEVNELRIAQSEIDSTLLELMEVVLLS